MGREGKGREGEERVGGWGMGKEGGRWKRRREGEAEELNPQHMIQSTGLCSWADHLAPYIVAVNQLSTHLWSTGSSQVLYIPDADSELPVTESPKSAPPCVESGSFTESVETIRSSSVSQVRCGRKERGGIRGEEVVVGVLPLCQSATSLLRR